ncbi:MAG TPA: DUF4252 domain-containing protein [Gammaproteobacteria bacterium]|jgi:hypothetical protein
MKTGFTAMALTLALAASGAQAQAQGGYFDFTKVPGLGDKPQVQIDLNSQMLGFIGVAAGTTDPDLADAFAGIENVRVLVYEKLEDPAAVAAFVEDSSGKLEAAGWQRIVYVEDEGEKVRVYAKLEESRMVGMTVMVLGEGDSGSDGGEATFINIAGNIDPAKLGRIASEVGVDGVLQGVEAAEAAGE